MRQVVKLLGLSLLLCAAQTEAFTLEQLQQMALENNPTLSQAVSEVRSAEGRKIQAGLYPNPSVGYAAEEVSIDHPSERAIHSVFAEQLIITAGKLKHGRTVFEHEQTEASVHMETRKRRILTEVRIIYYRALGAEKLVEIRRELAALAREAVDTTNQLYNVGQADFPDVLAAESVAEQAQIDFLNAETERDRVWRVLASVIGKPDLKRTRLDGELAEEIPEFEYDAVLFALLQESPQIKAAKSGIDRARAAVDLAIAGRYPDVTVGAGYSYNVEPSESQALFYVRIPLPLIDRNQGKITESRAHLDRAQEEVRRLELALRSELALVYADHRSASDRAKRYKDEILPRAKKAHELYLQRFRQMAASYPQVLIARRNMYQARVAYIKALTDLWQSVAAIEGYMLTGALDAPPAPGGGVEIGPVPTAHGVRLGR